VEIISPHMPEMPILRRRKALILAENVLYTKKMSKTPHASRSRWGAIFFGVFPRNRQTGA
jgi:hypothetical protein